MSLDNPLVSSSMVSMLPGPIQPVPGDSFHDRILLLLAAVANSDDLLTYRHYQLVQEAAQAIFGERALHAEVQAKLHYALLHPPVNPVDIARDMACQVDKQKVSMLFVDAILHGLDSIASRTERLASKGLCLVKEIEWALRRSHEERGVRLFGKQLAAPLAGLGDNLGKCLQFSTRLPGGRHVEAFGEKLSGQINERITEPLGEHVNALKRMASRVLPGTLHKSAPSRFSPETVHFNAEMEDFAASLDHIAWTLDDVELQEELQAFKKSIKDQPFKIVAVGERKRGKSSLINALLGQDLSPVRESSPETATVVAFHYAPAPEYSVRFLDSAQFSRLEEYLGHEEDNLLLRRKIAHIREGVSKGTFIPGRLISGVTCWSELPDYISLDGRYSCFVSRVDIGLPLDFLRDDVVVVDTPGLNDTDRFHDYLAYEESLEADCILFVMDARDPGSHSELSLLRKLARSGRTVTVTGILTNVDRLNASTSLDVARERARAVLLEACRTAEGVRITDVVAINTRQAMKVRCREESLAADLSDGLTRNLNKGISGGLDSLTRLTSPGSRLIPSSDVDEMETLLALLREAMEQDRSKAFYRTKALASQARIATFVRARVKAHMDAYRRSLPDPTLLSMLDVHAKQLASAASQSLDHARQVVGAAIKELDAWDIATEHVLDAFRDRLVLRLMDAVHAKVAQAGHQFAKESIWQEFEATEARDISRKVINEFLEDRREELQLWEDKLRLFATEMEAFSQDCLNRLSLTIEGLEGPSRLGNKRSDTATHFLVQTHRHMKNLAVFTTGVAVGRTLGPITLLATAGNILALVASSPLTAVVMAAVAGTAGLLYHLGREDKRKAAFLEKKRKEAEEYASRVREALKQELCQVRNELGQAYEFEIKRGFAPALESLFHQSVHLRLFLEVMRKIRDDADRYDKHVQDQLAQIQPQLPHQDQDTFLFS